MNFKFDKLLTILNLRIVLKNRKIKKKINKKSNLIFPYLIIRNFEISKFRNSEISVVLYLIVPNVDPHHKVNEENFRGPLASLIMSRVYVRSGKIYKKSKQILVI